MLRKVRVLQNSDDLGFWNQLSQQREPFSNNRNIKKADPGDIAARATDTGHETRYTGSAPVTKTIGMLVVAAFAARAASTLPTIAAT